MDEVMNFTDKVVLITGAASGFGAALAKAMADRGAKLVLGDINVAGLDSVVQGLSISEDRVLAMECDVSKVEHCKAMVDGALEKFNRLDIAVNNAGIGHDMKPLHECDEAMLEKQFEVNVKGVFSGMRFQIPVMLKQEDGIILNVSSMAGLSGAPKLGPYVAAKHAVAGLTKTAAIENANKGVRVNAVCPFFTPTAILTNHEGLSDLSTDFLAQGAPMKRLATVDEVITVMLMLCSPKNSYMTGQCVAVDGGVSSF